MAEFWSVMAAPRAIHLSNGQDSGSCLGILDYTPRHVSDLLSRGWREILRTEDLAEAQNLVLRDRLFQGDRWT